MGRVGLKLCNNENFAQLLAHLTSGSRGSVEMWLCIYYLATCATIYLFSLFNGIFKDCLIK